MTMIDATVGAGVGVATMALSVAMQVLATKGSTLTAGAGHRHGKGGGGRSGGGALSRAMGKLEMPRLHIAAFTTGGVGLSGTGLGHLINEMTTGVNGFVATWLSTWVGVGVGFLVPLGAATLLLLDVRDNRAGMRTLALAASMPFFVPMIPGVIGQSAAAVIAWIATGIGHIVAAMFGMG